MSHMLLDKLSHMIKVGIDTSGICNLLTENSTGYLMFEVAYLTFDGGEELNATGMCGMKVDETIESYNVKEERSHVNLGYQVESLGSIDG